MVLEGYEKFWVVLDGNELRVYETAEVSTFLGSFRLEKAKVHKSRTKRHHMTIEMNKVVWTEHVNRLEDSPNAALMARHPSINAAQAAGISIKEPPLIALRSGGDDGISSWVDQCKLASALAPADLKHWEESGGDVSTAEDLTDMTISDDETAQTQTSESALDDASQVSSTSQPQIGLGDAMVGLSSSGDKKSKKSRRTLSKDNGGDDKKRLLGSVRRCLAFPRVALFLTQIPQ